MTRLLVSVRDATEATAALAGGADFIDVKEPARGALGRADAQTLRDVCTTVGGRAVLSLALGELGDALPAADRPALAGFQFAKMGLAGARASSDWPLRWQREFQSLPSGVRPVAVVYADWQTCGAPSPDEILQHAAALRPRCSGLLIDTYSKQGRTSFDFMGSEQIAAIVAAARERGWRTLVAGALRREDLAQITALRPDVVAVRGAVCVGGRGGRLCAALVTEFRRALARDSHEVKLATTSTRTRDFA